MFPSNSYATQIAVKNNNLNYHERELIMLTMLHIAVEEDSIVLAPREKSEVAEKQQGNESLPPFQEEQGLHHLSELSKACKLDYTWKSEGTIQMHITNKLFLHEHNFNSSIEIHGHSAVLPQAILDEMNRLASFLFKPNAVKKLLPDITIYNLEQDLFMVVEVAVNECDTINTHKDFLKVVAILRSATKQKVEKYAAKINTYETFSTYSLLQSRKHVYFLEMQATLVGEEKALYFTLLMSKAYSCIDSIDLIATQVKMIMKKCEANSKQFIGSVNLEKIHKLPDTALTRNPSSRIPMEQVSKIYFNEMVNLSDEDLLGMLIGGTLHEPISCTSLLKHSFNPAMLQLLAENVASVNTFEDLTVYPVHIAKSFGNRIKLKHEQGTFLIVYKQNDKLHWRLTSDNSGLFKEKKKQTPPHKRDDYQAPDDDDDDNDESPGKKPNKIAEQQAIQNSSRKHSNDTSFQQLQLFLFAKCSFLLDTILLDNKANQTLVALGVYYKQNIPIQACIKVVPHNHLQDGFWKVYHNRFYLQHAYYIYHVATLQHHSYMNSILQTPCSVIISEHLHSLDHVMQAMQTLNKQQRMTLFHDLIKQMIKALQEVHHLEVIHGDISWGNVMFRDTNKKYTAVLIDFDHSSEKEQIGAFTYFYARSKQNSKQNDKFSMACVIARFYLYCIQGSKYLAKTPEEDYHLLQNFFQSNQAPSGLKRNNYLIEWSLRLHEQVKLVVFNMMHKDEELDLTLLAFEKSIQPLQEIQQVI